MYQTVNGPPRAGIPPLLDSRAPLRVIQAIELALGALRYAFDSRRERRAAIRELQKLDAHLLQDLGIERREIPEIVAMRARADRR